MAKSEEILKPSKKDQQTAMESYDALAAMIGKLKEENPKIEIAETAELIKVPLSALKLLAKILKAMSEGKPISLVPIATELTTQAAADLLGCSRPHFVKLLESGEINFTRVGRHRRVKYDDVMRYKEKMKIKQRDLLIEMMRDDEDSGLYDS